MFKVSTAISKFQHVFSRLIGEVFYNLVDQSLWQVAPDYLKCFLEFGDSFQLCFKLVVSLQHCTLHVIIHWVYTVSQKTYQTFSTVT